MTARRAERAGTKRWGRGPRAAWAVAPILAAVLLAGCGSSSTHTSTTQSSASHGEQLALAANPSGALKYDRKVLRAKAGTVTISFTNSSSVVHNMTISDSSGIVGATPTFSGGTKALTIKLAPGTYTFYCSVPGHEEAGMKGTLVVG
jgi:plastocyanin